MYFLPCLCHHDILIISPLIYVRMQNIYYTRTHAQRWPDFPRQFSGMARFYKYLIPYARAHVRVSIYVVHLYCIYTRSTSWNLFW